jgi:hypothetical protein
VTRLHRLATAAVGVLLALVATAAPAAADPARPTSDRSTVDRIEPPVDGISLQVVGGDAFLRLEADPGVEVDVPGYGGEPYLRFLADGTVERNLRSRATYINEDRLGDAPTPADLEVDDEPRWERVASDGTYAWHDHRIHWMSPDRPPGLSPGDVIEPAWEVRFFVDGNEVTATGSLVWEEDVSPLPWLVVAVLVAGAALALARGGRRSALVAGGAALVGAVVAAAVGFAEWSAVPPEAGGSMLVVAVPAVGVVAAGAGLVLRGRGSRTLATLVAVSAVLGWAVRRVGVFLEPVLPTDLSPTLDRAATALAVGAAVAAATLAVRSGSFALPRLLEDDGRPAAT